MTLLVLSLLALPAAPLIYLGIERLGKRRVIIERCVILIVAALVLINILPESVEQAGWPALLVAACGMILPSFVERFWHGHTRGVHSFPVFIVIFGVGIHALLDGVALSLGGITETHDGLGHHHHEVLGDGHIALPLAVVLHRFPEAVFLWWLLRPRYGISRAAAALTLVGVGTLIGFFTGPQILSSIGEGRGMGLFQALVAGSLLHLASHQVK